MYIVNMPDDIQYQQLVRSEVCMWGKNMHLIWAKELIWTIFKIPTSDHHLVGVYATSHLDWRLSAASSLSRLTSNFFSPRSKISKMSRLTSKLFSPKNKQLMQKLSNFFSSKNKQLMQKLSNLFSPKNKQLVQKLAKLPKLDILECQARTVNW